MRSETSATNAYACAYVHGKRMCYAALSKRPVAWGRGHSLAEARLLGREVNAWFREIYMYTGNTVHSASILLREGVAPRGEHDCAYIPVAL